MAFNMIEATMAASRVVMNMNQVISGEDEEIYVLILEKVGATKSQRTPND
jgi:hypothetical protein